LVRSSILDAVGSTPLVRLTRLFPAFHLRLYAKLESLNPGGSAKDRPATLMLRRAIAAGRVGPHTTIVESSSGNMAIGLAQACAYLGLRLICVVDARTTPQHLKLLGAYGAAVEVVHTPDPTTGELLHARVARVKALIKEIDDAFWPNQYSNPDNALAHTRTVQEIHEELGEAPDYLFCATSTCGTLRGCSDAIAALGVGTRLVAVDAVGSAIFGSPQCRRLIPGHGASMRPPLVDGAQVSQVVHVSDLDCVVGCRRLVAREGILGGGSAGGVIQAIERMSGLMSDGALAVVIIADGGERYLDTIYSDAWVAAHFGDVSHAWKGSIAAGHRQPVVAES
jgi:2,3-diaminopropionate biosynthesis protein SbnA